MTDANTNNNAVINDHIDIRRDDNSEYIKELETANRQLRTTLQNLVKLKKYKDTHGKDEHYKQNQPLAWAAAEKALK